MTGDFRNIRYVEDGPVATLTFDRPDILNSMDEVMTGEIVSVIERLRRPGAIRALVIASTGRCFSAGGNFDEIQRLIEDYDARMDAYDNGRRVIHGMAEIAMPVIVALQGDVYGLGTSLALSADILVASKNVRIGDPHVKVGLVAGDGGTLVWPAAFGLLKAKRHLLTGDPIGAEEAHRLGAVSELVDEPEQVLPLAQELARKVAALPPLAVQYTKRALNHSMQRAALDHFEFAMALEQYAMTSADLKEALAALKEKRKPSFSNR
ncbi:enoyl-CoA hydratase/isomerase family protein [Flavisphingomonas formosensis]|uniref:enoyl-CoA hydratase/isomerase family protein n=1 Tax=Flavisphingomonas formosensis TaxID=861534 RepID=UPI0018E00BD8|nr:enoyl-CoA hydratase/isomerase family protein [Sphingomonas formosensis]